MLAKYYIRYSNSYFLYRNFIFVSDCSLHYKICVNKYFQIKIKISFAFITFVCIKLFYVLFICTSKSKTKKQTGKNVKEKKNQFFYVKGLNDGDKKGFDLATIYLIDWFLWKRKKSVKVG